MLAGIWGFAAWTVLSMLWSESPSAAWEGGARDIFYAALVTVPLVLVPRARVLPVLAVGLVGGIAVLALLTLVRMLVGDDGLFLAGRLDAPVGYRNATALLFALGVWPLLALAACGPRRAFRAGAFSLAVLCLALAFLTQSRGIVVGLATGGIVALAFGPDRVRRAWLAILALALLAAFSSGLLTPYHAFDGGQGIVADSDIGRAAWTTLLLMVVAFGVGLAYALVDNGLRTGTEGSRRVAHVGARAGLALVVVIAIIGAVSAVGNPITEARAKWDEFTANQTVATGATRYANVSGQRYDLWRVSLNAFADRPLTGVGEASYPFRYYVERRTDRNLDDPHGLPFQVLSELGIVGALLVAAFIVGAAATLVSRWTRVPPSAAGSRAGWPPRVPCSSASRSSTGCGGSPA
ncbi:MAG: O-antigen ligase family protein [Solirubrobacterales bacterium]